MINTKSYAAFAADQPLKPYSFTHRAVGPEDVHIAIQYCGICHSDIHNVRNEWGGAMYPMVPGHEIAGVVKEVGAKVKKFKPGDVVGVGCLVNSCRHCNKCHEGYEQFCEKGNTLTYNSVEPDGNITKGGYADHIVVNEHFVVKMPSNLKLAAAAPLLCAGITTYAPLKAAKVGKGHKVGVIGLGGLGHMAVKLAHAMGAHVVLFTTSANKKADALRLGANEVVLSSDAAQMEKFAGYFDLIIDTVSAPHNLDQYMNLLKVAGTLCMLGASPTQLSIDPFSVIIGHKILTGSLIGGIALTQEMLDFCGKHNITCDIEEIPIQKVNEAFERILKSDVKYRFVIDMKSLV